MNGGRETVNAILDHPGIRAVSFVGATPTAKYIYSRAAANGKRAQCQGGAKNPVVVMPDADMEMTTRILADSAFGCAGQRCLAASVAITVGSARPNFTEQISAAAKNRKTGYGAAPGVEMGPVISAESKTRIEGLIARGEQAGARVIVDGRGKKVPEYEDGYFLMPTVLDDVPPDSEAARTEIFGPVLSLIHAQTIEEAIALVNGRSYGNMACIFTTDGANARRFPLRSERGQRWASTWAWPRRCRPFRSADGLRELFRRSARAGSARGGVFHADQGCGGAMAEGVEQEVLKAVDIGTRD